MSENRENRKYPRIGKPLDAVWRGTSGGSACVITDVSWGGCFVQTPEEPALEEHTSISTVIGGREVTLTGAVVYRERTIGFAVQFDPLSGEQIDVMKDLLGVPPDFLVQMISSRSEK
jgi:hypothetical protein